MDKFRLYVYMLMTDASLEQRIPYIMRTSIFAPFSAGKKCALYTGKHEIEIYLGKLSSCSCNSQFGRNPHRLSEDCKVYNALFSVKYTPVVFLP